MQFVFFTGLVASEPESFDLFPAEDAKDGTDTSYCLFDVAVRKTHQKTAKFARNICTKA